MSLLPKEGYRRVLVLAAYGALALGVGYLFLRYLLKPFLPFLLAWIIAMAVRPTVHRIVERVKLPRKAVSFVSVLFVYLLAFGCLTVLGGRMLGEMRELSDELMGDAAGAVGDLLDSVGAVLDKLPFLDRVEDPEAAEQLRRTAVTLLENAVGSLSLRLSESVMGVVTSLPGLLLFTVVMIVATFYLAPSVETINGFIARQLPAASRHYLFEAKGKLMTAGVRYVKAYLTLLLITFVQLLIGFLCLGVPYALTLAALIALIDILPVLGVGTVLVPWAAVLLVQGNTYLGVGLLLLFGIIWIIRQVIEPRIVGNSIGLPPLLTLVVTYVGYECMGFAGLFVFPLGAILLKNLHDIGVLRLWRT